MTEKKHPFLFIPGPVNVRDDVLEAQTEAMIGHRTADFESLFAACEDMLKQLFFTEQRVYISASSGSGTVPPPDELRPVSASACGAAGGYAARLHSSG